MPLKSFFPIKLIKSILYKLQITISSKHIKNILIIDKDVFYKEKVLICLSNI